MCECDECGRLYMYVLTSIVSKINLFYSFPNGIRVNFCFEIELNEYQPR